MVAFLLARKMGNGVGKFKHAPTGTLYTFGSLLMEPTGIGTMVFGKKAQKSFLFLTPQIRLELSL